MRRVSVAQWAVLGALTAFAPWVWAADCSAPVSVPEKPELSQFSDYNAFLVQAMDYKASKRKQARHRQACPQAYQDKKRPNRNPTVIEKPETLSEALQRAEKIPRLDYSEHQKWYGRTTSRTFPLPDLGRDRLSDNMLESNLRMMLGAARPRSGAELLPGIYSYRLNDERVDGERAQGLIGRRFAQLLPRRQSEAENASSSFGFGPRLASIFQVQDNERGTLRLFIGQNGGLNKSVGSVYVQDCLSSCVGNP